MNLKSESVYLRSIMDCRLTMVESWSCPCDHFQTLWGILYVNSPGQSFNLLHNGSGTWEMLFSYGSKSWFYYLPFSCYRLNQLQEPIILWNERKPEVNEREEWIADKISTVNLEKWNRRKININNPSFLSLTLESGYNSFSPATGSFLLFRGLFPGYMW